MKKSCLIIIISLQIAILPVLGIMLYIFLPVFYDIVGYGDIGNTAIIGWLAIVLLSVALAIFCSIKIKKWYLIIAYIILNILLFVFVSIRWMWQIVG